MRKTKPFGITVRLPPALYKQLSDRASAEGRSVNQEAIRLLQDALNAQEALKGLEQQIQENKNKTDQLLQFVAGLQGLVADLQAVTTELKTKRETNPRRVRDKDVTVADVAEQSAGVE